MSRPPAPAASAGSPIVVAESAPGFRQVSDTLAASGLPLLGVDSVAQAKAAVRADTPLVLCGCHFDEGRLYELLRHIKARPVFAGIPFLTIRVEAGELDDALYESVKIATALLGGNGFVDLFRWRRLYGPAEADRQFAEHVTSLARG